MGMDGGMNRREEQLGCLKPEVKVAIAIDMIDSSMRVCACSIREQSPSISDEELRSRLRERLMWSKR